MRFAYEIPVVVLGAAAIVIVQSPVVVGLTAVEVNNIAKAITVRIDGSNPGSGVIINRQGNTYTVLTNWHVVQLKGDYTIQTPDGQRYQVNPKLVKPLSEVDLAIVQFESTQSYRKPELGNAEQLIEGTTVYVAGWAVADAVSIESSYRFVDGRISGRLSTNKAKNGYSLIYTNTTKPGMSGGPVLDEQGRLVGINGQAITDIRTGGIDFFGIPINTYLQVSSAFVGSLVATNNTASSLQGSNSLEQKPSSVVPSKVDIQSTSQVSTHELENYLRALSAMKPERQEAFEEIRKIVGGEEVPKIDCNDQDSLNYLPQEARDIAVNYCKRSQKILEDNGLTFDRFNQITAELEEDNLKRQVDNASPKLQMSPGSQHVELRFLNNF